MKLAKHFSYFGCILKPSKARHTVLSLLPGSLARSVWHSRRERAEKQERRLR